MIDVLPMNVYKIQRNWNRTATTKPVDISEYQVKSWRQHESYETSLNQELTSIKKTK